MVSSRTPWLIGLLLVSAAGLLVAGLIGLWRGVRDAENSAAAEARRRATVTASAIRGVLVDPEFLGSLPPSAQVRIADARLLIPEEIASIQSLEDDPESRSFDWRVEAALRQAARLEQGEGDPDGALKSLVSAVQGDENLEDRDRARLHYGAAWIALRLDDRESARTHRDQARDRWRELAPGDETENLSSTTREVDLPLLVQDLALAAKLEGRWDEDSLRHFGLLPEARREGMIASGVLARLPQANRDQLEALDLRRRRLRQIEAALPGLVARRESAVLRRGELLWIWTPQGSEGSGRVFLLAADKVQEKLRPYVDLSGLKIVDDANPALEDPIPVSAGLVLDMRGLTPEQGDLAIVVLPILGLGLIFVIALFATLRAVREEARAAATRADFTTMVTHELKTPLASIRLLAEMLEEDRVPDEERRREYYERLSGESARLGMLVENVLDLGRLEKGERAYDRRRIRPDDVVTETLDLFAPLADRDGLRIERQLDAAGIECDVDRGALAQVLLNLFENARKYALSGERLEVSTRAVEGQHCLMVRDYGPGLPLAERELVFDRFVRGKEQAHGNIPGVGLGLFLARRILRDQGGDLRVDAPEDGGAGLAFCWTLPATGDEG
jgi:signal transduction histidine kinase